MAKGKRWTASDIEKLEKKGFEVIDKITPTSFIGDIVRLDVCPMGAPRQVRSDAWKKRPIILKYRAVKDALRAEVNKHKAQYLIDKILETGKLKMDVYLPMPDSWSIKEREKMALKPHRVKPDVDNIVKGMMDCFYESDSAIWSLDVRKYYDSFAGTGAYVIYLPK